MITILHLMSDPTRIDRHLGRQLDAVRARGYHVVADSGSSAQLDALVSEVQPDIVHAHDANLTIPVRKLGTTGATPITVNSVHSYPDPGPVPLAHRVALARGGRTAGEHFDAHLVHDTSVVDALRSRGVRPERIHVVGRGIDLESFTPSRASSRAARCLRLQLDIGQRTRVVTVWGGQTPMDGGLGGFFDAVKILRRSMRPHQLVFLVVGKRWSGHGAVDPAMAATMSVDDGVHFLDDDVDDRTVLAMTDICVVPAGDPTHAGSAMAASAMGVPVVALDLREIRSAVGHQRTGLLVRPGKPEHLALTIERLLLTQSMCSDLGRAGRAKAVDEFDDRRVVERTVQVYEDLLTAKGLAAPEQYIDLDEPWYADSIDLVDRGGSVADRSSIS